MHEMMYVLYYKKYDYKVYSLNIDHRLQLHELCITSDIISRFFLNICLHLVELQ